MNGWPTTNEPPQGNFIDWWTPPHMAVGAVCSLVGLDWKDALILALGWEVLENLHIIPRSHWKDETFRNTVGDIAANMAGFFLAEKIK